MISASLMLAMTFVGVADWPWSLEDSVESAVQRCVDTYGAGADIARTTEIRQHLELLPGFNDSPGYTAPPGENKILIRLVVSAGWSTPTGDKVYDVEWGVASAPGAGVYGLDVRHFMLAAPVFADNELQVACSAPVNSRMGIWK